MSEKCDKCAHHKTSFDVESSGYCDVFDDWCEDIEYCSMFEEKAA